MKLSIGEFSKITSLTIKSLRLYHEKGLLIPSEVDEYSQYRFYDEKNYETAHSIKILKEHDFSLAEIKEILSENPENDEILIKLQKKFGEVQKKIERYKEISESLQNTINIEKEYNMSTEENFEIEEKNIETLLIAGYRMTGKYSDIGKGFSKLGKKFGRHINGKPIALYYDSEYKEDNADFEACFPVRKGSGEDEVSVRELKGGKCVCLIHKGSYDKLHNSYKKIFSYINEKGYSKNTPTREAYLKGPGMIFKGNPKNYLTEIQILIKQ